MKFRSNGFTLLEIMIAVLIISIGITALANLQGKLTRYSALAKQRTVAMNLAEQQIETMHSFYTMGATGAEPCAMAQSGYDDLADCVNGNTLTVGTMQFRLSWAIDAFIQNADGTTDRYAADSVMLRPDLKLVTIRVEWDDGQGDTLHVELVDIVDGTSVFNTGRVLARVDSNKPPRTPFNPADFPGVVEIAIGSDKIKGSTTPKPKIVNKGVNVITSFDVVTFLQTGINAYLQRREEFKVANCICTMDTGPGTGRTPTPWNGEEYTLGEQVSKRTGSVSANESGQPAACEMCCNDHHDASGASVKYDAFRPAFSGDAGNFDFLGDHAHYRIVDGSKMLADEGDDYLEACRFIRKDGFFQLTTDLSVQNLDVVKATYPLYFNTDYSSSVVNFVTEFTDLLSVPEYPASVPAPTYSSNASGIFLGNVGVTVQAMSRGIYVDYITDELLMKIKCLKADGTGPYSDYCDTFKDPTWLEILPFFDVDVTSLANWNRGAPTITVTNSPISDIDSAGFSRGAVAIAQEHYDVLTDVSASIEKSNSGLTDTNPVDPDDELEVEENLPVQVLIGGSPPAAGAAVLGDILAGSNKVNVETVRIRQNPPNIPCEIITIVEGQTSRKAYTCDLNPIPSNGSITISDYNALKITGNTSTVLNRKVCPGGTGFSGVSVIDEGVMANPDLGIAGERTVLTFSALSANVTVPITIKEQADACP
jgi:prepilin-type N-terminal cleavage/methylation domain-containing protein